MDGGFELLFYLLRRIKETKKMKGIKRRRKKWKEMGNVALNFLVKRRRMEKKRMNEGERR